MKSSLARLLPIVVGLALGWLLFHPPGALRSLGSLSYLVMAVVVALLLIAAVAAMISTNLPADISLKPLSDSAAPPELRSLAAAYESLGFVPVGPPFEAGVSPPAILLAFVNEEERSYGTAFRTTTLPAKTAFDFVSCLEGDRGGLTTGAEPGGAALPAGAGSFRQVFPAATVDQLFQRHREAISFLRTRGFACKRVTAATFAADLKRGIARQRKDFFASPVVNTVIAIWRSATRSTPHIGPLAQQPGVARQLMQLATGTRG